MRRQLVVTYHDRAIMYYPVDADRSWKIDPSWRCLIIGKGVPRTFVPLDQVRSFDIEQIYDATEVSPQCDQDEVASGYRCTQPLCHPGWHKATVNGSVVATWPGLSS
jgi:hypothetical protein